MPDSATWMRRWLFEYNPMYLVSAAVTLAGVIALSHEVAALRGPLAQLGITAIAEAYAWALIGSAALLVRRDQRRPAVMLALLAMLYQCDPTLHTATCAWLGLPGAIGSALWLASFFGKARALAWAMQLRVSCGAWALLAAGGTGLAGLPWVLRQLDGPWAANVVVAWVFGLLAAGLWSSRRIGSRVALHPWASTVARRSLRGVWAGLAVVAVLHAGFWTVQHPSLLHPGMFVPLATLLGTRAMDSEGMTWLTVAGTLGWIAHVMPSQLALTAAMAAVVLVLRALRSPRDVVDDTTPRPADPYRALVVGADPVAPYRVFLPLARAPRHRLLVGALACVYLGAWTVGWAGGPWPEHVVGLDLLLLAAGGLGWRRGHRLPMLPASLATLHWVIVERLVPTPSTTLQWGIVAVVAGFVLLGLSLLTSLRWTGRAPR